MCVDIGRSFQKFVNGIFPKYRGVVLERKDGGYVYNGVWYPNIEAVDKAIDERINALNLSLNRLKTNQ